MFEITKPILEKLKWRKQTILHILYDEMVYKRINNMFLNFIFQYIILFYKQCNYFIINLYIY